MRGRGQKVKSDNNAAVTLLMVVVGLIATVTGWSLVSQNQISSTANTALLKAAEVKIETDGIKKDREELRGMAAVHEKSKDKNAPDPYPRDLPDDPPRDHP